MIKSKNYDNLFIKLAVTFDCVCNQPFNTSGGVHVHGKCKNYQLLFIRLPIISTSNFKWLSD